MTIEKIRMRALKLHRRTRLELYGNTGMGLLAIAISVPGILLNTQPLLRGAFAFAVVWALAGQYFLHRGMWSSKPPGDAARSTGIDFYKQELELRNSLMRRVLQWTFGPVVISICGLIIALTGVAESKGLSGREVLPFSVVFAVWIVGMVVQSWMRRRALQREIAALTAFEKAC